MVQIRSSNPKLTLEEYEKFEQDNNIHFPDEYKTFLLEHNGGYPDKSTFKILGENEYYESVLNVFYGIGEMYDNLQKNIDFSDELIEIGYVPIADDSGGNQICICVLNNKLGEIFFWEHELGNEDELDNLFFVSDTFTTFIDNLYN